MDDYLHTTLIRKFCMSMIRANQGTELITTERKRAYEHVVELIDALREEEKRVAAMNFGLQPTARAVWPEDAGPPDDAA